MGGSDHNSDAAADAWDASNAVRLSWPQWLLAGAVAAGALAAAPHLWEAREAFEPSGDYRLPYALSEDYWLFAHYARRAAGEGEFLVVGDSVVWGHYVAPAQTLSGHLNRLSGAERFANLGVDGIHPAAMAGLLAHYGEGISGARVVLHCNPLWLASPDHDLTSGGEVTVNHPRLLPQFHPNVPCYRADPEQRLSACVDRTLPFRGWAWHLRAAYFAEADRPQDLPRWTIRHPRDNPFAAIARGLPSPIDRPRDQPRPWQARSLAWPWVDLDSSLQWRLFRESVAVLRRRGNRLFVVVGPFNEHMLEAPSRARYAAVKQRIAQWLHSAGLPCHVAALLPAEVYADASHPLGRGYEALAEALWREPAFARFAGLAGEQRVERIVFCSDRSGAWRIWTMRADGSGLKQLTRTEDDARDVDPVFAPDGRSVLFTSTRGGEAGLWRMDLPGGEPRRICDGDQGEFGPDGRRVVFRRGGRIVTRELASGTEKAVSPPGWTGCSGPAWSPDGRTIAFARRVGRRNAIHLVPAGGGKATTLQDKHAACEPHFSPDGGRIVYETELHIHTIRIDGTDDRPVTWYGGVQRYGRFSPDGKSVVFCQAPSPEGPWQIYVVPAAGGTPRKLTEGASDMHPQWKRIPHREGT